MWKEKKTRAEKAEKHEAGTCPMIVGEVVLSARRMRNVKSKEKVKVATSSGRSATGKATATCEQSGNVMRLCVDMMPVLASAKEPLEEGEEDEEEESGSSGKEADGRENNLSEESCDEPGVPHTGLTLDRATETKPAASPRFVLPLITQQKPAPETKRCHTLLPPISSPEQTIISPNGPVTGPAPDHSPWIDNPLYSKSRAAEFRLPDISLSSLEALLQTVTQKLGRQRGECDGRRVQSDHVLVVEHCFSETRVGQQAERCTDRNLKNIPAVSGTSAGGWRVNRQRRSLPSLCSASKPALVLTMTKKNLLTSNTLQ